MLEDCCYINGDSLERHNFGDKPVTLNDIPTDLDDPDFEDNLLKMLKMNNGIDSSTIELLWGDIQLGKRVHACIVMWISVFVLKRPVLYIFRNLKIDQSQLSDDIIGTDEFSFNIQYIKKCFDEYVSEEIGGIGIDDYKGFKLPELKPITKKEVLNKLSNKESLNPTDIFCCLMNHTQLEKINNKCNEYLSYNKELLNITLLVDESDLYAPTSSNNNENSKDIFDSTKCEKLLAKIYKKVRYVLHITGTAHSLLYNITTKLNHNSSIQIQISKVHKMKRKEKYYGLFNDKIKFNTEVDNWWNRLDENGKNRKFTIKEDFNINIERIIGIIKDRPQERYHSFLISEEKIRTNQFELKDLIISNFSDLFVIVFHGNCLNLYLPKRYESKLIYYSKIDSEKCNTGQRLYQEGGIYKKSLDTEKSRLLPNEYSYYQINSKTFNIKLVYKILAMLFSHEKSIDFRTVITITGKYGERGYSFTSDDYDKYPFHLTDQYFPCHSKNKNCTDISQRLRLQGKYSDQHELTLWTSNELKDIITLFYLPFIKEIEKDIMGCQSWEEIKISIEDIIDNGLMKLGKYMKYIDSAKKRKNIQIDKKWDKKGKGYRLFKIDDVDEDWIREWCSRNGLPEYVCVNEIMTDMSKEEFISRYGMYERVLEEDVSNPEIFNSILEYENYCTSKEIPKRKFKYNSNGFIETSITGNKRVYSLDEVKKELFGFSKGSNLGIKSNTKYDENHKFTRVYACYDDNNTLNLVLRVCRVKNSKLTLPKNTIDIKKTPYYLDENKNKLSYTKLKSEWKDKFNDTSGYVNEGDNFIEDGIPPIYYWKTPDGWLYLHDDTKTKDDIVSIHIVNPIDSENIVIETRKDVQIERFVKECIREPTNPRLRIGLREIMNVYKKWCKNKGIGQKGSKIMKGELNKFRFRYDKSKGIDLKGKLNKRGYKIDFNMEIYNSLET